MQILFHLDTRNLVLINMEKAANWLPPFLCGFLALSFQIILMREFMVYFQGNEITFGILLACWFLWTGLGSLTANKFKYNRSWFILLYYVTVFLFLISLTALRFSRFILKTLPGEITGLLPMLLHAMVTTSLICFPLGMLFVLNVKKWKGRIGQVYLAEALGSATAGLLVYFLLIPAFSNWRSTVLISGLSALIIYIPIGRKKLRGLFLSISIILTLFWIMDYPTQKIFWSPFDLILSKDTRYAKWDLIKNGGQISFYNNTVPVYSFPDPAAAEETVHFPLCQHQAAERVLLIGGGAGGCLKELLKYPQLTIDYVELDPETINLAVKFLPADESALFHSPRVSLINQDGRVFLSRTLAHYDIILLNLPDPVTAQLNRFYTLEFFSQVKDKLNNEGIFSFQASGAENYLSPERQDYLSAFYFTLAEIFTHIKVIPGARTIFLASSQPLTLESKILQARLAERELNNSVLTPDQLPFRLDPLRIDLLIQKIKQGKIRINQDLKPVNYFFTSVLWATQFKGFAGRFLPSLMRVGSFWLLDFPLLFFILILLYFAARRSQRFFLLVPLFVLGLTTIILEIVLINAFQVFQGYLYHSLAMLFATFMLGLAGGAYLGLKKKGPVFSDLMLTQSGFILITLLVRIMLRVKPSPVWFYFILFLTGSAAGYFFLISNRQYLKHRQKYGTGYGLDLMGSFLGALVVSSFILPLFGLIKVTGHLVLLNFFTLIFMVFGHKISR